MEWTSVITLAVALIVLGFNVAMVIVIKFNDFVHLEKGMARIEKKVDSQDARQATTNERLAAIEATCKLKCGAD